MSELKDYTVDTIQANLQMADYRVDKKYVDGVWMADLSQHSSLVKYAVRCGVRDVRLTAEEMDNAKKRQFSHI